MDKAHVEESIQNGLSVKEVINVPCRNLNDILDEYSFVPDYLSIDIEGMDYKVLRSIDYSRYDIKVIIAEMTDKKNENGETMDDYMKNVGYAVYGKYGANVIYVKDKQTENKLSREF